MPVEAISAELAQRSTAWLHRIGMAFPTAELAIPFQNTYARLPERFFARIDPTPVPAPRLLRLNQSLAEHLGLDPQQLASPAGVEFLAGNQVVASSEPLAMAYAGHQFANFVPQLGDGRANLLGELIGRDGNRYDVHLKGSGRTPFSRRGDGRAAVGPVLREYLISEAMAALGIPTTRTLAAVATGERVYRERPLPGAVLVRVAASHLRVGTFEYFAARRDLEALDTLIAYAMQRHDADLAPSALGLLERVTRRQALLVAQWMSVGFVHGVMNTDNCAISGETIDYGPCAFLEEYDPAAVFSSIDQMGRYAFQNQPHIALWNVTRLADALLPVLERDFGGRQEAIEQAMPILEGFAGIYEQAHLDGLRRKFGLTTSEEGDRALIEALLHRMHVEKADFTLTFWQMCAAADGDDAGVRACFKDATAWDSWAAEWRLRLQREPAGRSQVMCHANPRFIPRNHLVEEALSAAERDDMGPFERLLAVISDPYREHPGADRLALPARPEERVTATFCGT